MLAEIAYLFRHALQRDAAYQIQTPGERAVIHAAAFLAMERLRGGAAPELEMDEWGDINVKPHSTDTIAADLAMHAAEVYTETQDQATSEAFRQRELNYCCRAAAHAERQGLRQLAIKMWRRMTKISAGPICATAHIRCASQERESGSPDIAEQLVHQGLEVPLSGQNRLSVLAKAATELSAIYHQTGRVDDAKKTYTDAIAKYQELGNHKQEAAALSGLASVQYYNGDTTDAEETLSKALEIQQSLGDRRGEAKSLVVLANVLKNSGRSELAEAKYKLCLEVNREVNNLSGVAQTLMNIGCLYMETVSNELAETHFLEALEISQRTGNLSSEGAVLTNMAALYNTSGRKDLAAETFLRGLEIVRESGNRRFEGVITGNQALVYQNDGQLELAEELYLQALDIHREMKFMRFEGLVLCNYALLKIRQKDTTAAEKLWLEGVGLLRELGDTLSLERKINSMNKLCAKYGLEPFGSANENSNGS
ncbi:MAG: tetratricopeptide repeat protein [Planctomycetota bacterium]|jgi:tetratricopeptide (TPR) repeat protein